MHGKRGGGAEVGARGGNLCGGVVADGLISAREVICGDVGTTSVG